jgi:hypothetical protein
MAAGESRKRKQGIIGVKHEPPCPDCILTSR